jgi:hypothetical protein
MHMPDVGTCAGWRNSTRCNLLRHRGTSPRVERGTHCIHAAATVQYEIMLSDGQWPPPRAFTNMQARFTRPGRRSTDPEPAQNSLGPYGPNSLGSIPPCHAIGQHARRIKLRVRTDRHAGPPPEIVIHAILLQPDS